MPTWVRLGAKLQRCSSASASRGRKEEKVEIKNRQKLLIILSVTVVALFAADQLVRAPLFNAWQARASRVAALRSQVARGKMLLQRERGIHNHWDEMQRKSLTNNLSAAEQQLFR